VASDAPALDAAAIAAAFNEHGVRYVVIGAFAAIAQGAPIAPTRDVDFTVDDSSDNLARLSAALTELDARVRTDSVEDGLPFAHDAASLARAGMWNLICSYGEFDIAFRPSGFQGGYTELQTHAHRVMVDGVDVSVADLDDVIRSKEAAGRPKDLQVLPGLYRYRASR
jgi:predicted nucleotidyltransferase